MATDSIVLADDFSRNLVRIMKVVPVGADGSPATSGVPTIASASVTNGGSTITLGGTAQTALAAGTTPNGFLVQNQSADHLYIRQTTTATADQNAIRIPPGQMYVADFLTGGLVSIIGPTTGQAFAAKGW